MSKVLDRIEELIDEGAWTYANAVAIATAEQLERIADALEKQNASDPMVTVEGKATGKGLHLFRTNEEASVAQLDGFELRGVQKLSIQKSAEYPNIVNLEVELLAKSELAFDHAGDNLFSNVE